MKARPSWRSLVVCLEGQPRQYRAFLVSSSTVTSAKNEFDIAGTTTLGGSNR
jgi:hypothetical protein